MPSTPDEEAAAKHVDERQRRHRRHHELHEHVEPVGADGRRAPREEGRREGPHDEAVGEDEPRAGLEGRHRVPRATPASSRTSSSSASTSSATAARRASATAARCPPAISKAIDEQDLVVVVGALAATATSRAASTPRSARTTSRRRRSSSRTRSPARVDIDLTTEPLGTGKDGKPVFLKDIWPTQQEVARRDREGGHAADVQEASTPTSTRATRSGSRSQVPEGDLYAWERDSTYVKNPPYFDGMTRAARRRSSRRARRARARACSATASRPTTSRRPARSRRTARRASTSSSTA